MFPRVKGPYGFGYNQFPNYPILNPFKLAMEFISKVMPITINHTHTMIKLLHFVP